MSHSARMIERFGGVGRLRSAWPTASTMAEPAALSVAPCAEPRARHAVPRADARGVAARAEVVVVAADEHVLVRQLAAGDDGEQVRAAICPFATNGWLVRLVVRRSRDQARDRVRRRRFASSRCVRSENGRVVVPAARTPVARGTASSPSRRPRVAPRAACSIWAGSSACAHVAPARRAMASQATDRMEGR